MEENHVNLLESITARLDRAYGSILCFIQLVKMWKCRGEPGKQRDISEERCVKITSITVLVFSIEFIYMTEKNYIPP